MSFEEVPRDPSLADPLSASPLPLLERWLRDARERSGQPNPDAMALATVDAAGEPRARMVLCRGFDALRGQLVFYTNRESAKGRELAARPFAAAVFHWDALARQARIDGPVRLAPDALSDAYFAGRPRDSQIAAWASRQSAPIASRRALLDEIEAAAERFGGVDAGPPVPRPPHWGGYLLVARRVELWVGCEGRAHDRAEWERVLGDPATATADSGWRVRRLQP
jgi:pyridoxamine 5'-phosphate oxidase